MNENVKIVFLAYLRQKWIDVRQTKISMITDQFYTYRRLHVRYRYVRLTSLYMAVMMSDGLDVVTVKLE